jgi:hypothetical protein
MGERCEFSLGRIKIVFGCVKDPAQRSQASVELVHRWRGKRKPDGVRRMTGRGGKRGRGRQRNVPSCRSGDQRLRAPMGWKRQPQMKAFPVRLDIETRETVDGQLLPGDCVESLESRKFGDGAVTHQSLRRRKRKPRRGPST